MSSGGCVELIRTGGMSGNFVVIGLGKPFSCAVMGVKSTSDFSCSEIKSVSSVYFLSPTCVN